MTSTVPTPKNEARPCTIEDLFVGSERMDAEECGALEAYLAPFAAPIRRGSDYHCLACDERQDALMQAIGLAVAFRWELTHGEARCTGCGWPARGMHYIRDAAGGELATIRNVFLSYHPDHVKAVRDPISAVIDALDWQS